MLQSKITFLFLVAVILGGNAQHQIPGTTYTQFSLNSKKDTIDFVIAETNLTVKKPVFLFIQGSLPIPLFIDFPGQGIGSSIMGNFDLDKLKEHYYVVIISMPKTPVVSDVNQLNSNYCYVTNPKDEHSFDPNYLEADYLENYVNRANKVIDYLHKQAWVDKSKLIVAGHSQGSRIAAELASTNQKVTKAGLFGFSPLGRVHEQVWLNYKEAMKGTISWEKLDTLQQQQIDFQKVLYNKAESGPSLVAWRSFTGIGFERLAQIKTPLYIAYGTEDKCAFVNELLPLYFIQAGKTNYEVKRYPNLEHNYFPIVDGKPDPENGKWMEVMNAFLEWSLKE
jgi:pimeloyl-ACP methyl ester carboxylesterase